jgi:hypothetical protein
MQEQDREGPQSMPKARIARGPKGVAKDVLMEDPWPEAFPLLLAPDNLLHCGDFMIIFIF